MARRKVQPEAAKAAALAQSLVSTVDEAVLLGDLRTLQQKIGGMLYQRTALSKRLDAVIAAEIGKLRTDQLSLDTQQPQATASAPCVATNRPSTAPNCSRFCNTAAMRGVHWLAIRSKVNQANPSISGRRSPLR